MEPLQEGEEVTDTAGKNWKLLKLLSQSTTELLYEGEAAYRTYLLESKINVQLDRLGISDNNPSAITLTEIS